MLNMDKDKQLFFTILAVLVVVVVVFLYSLYVGRVSPGYSEIWLTGEISSAVAGEEFELGFVVANNEEQEMNYEYKIIFEGVEKANGNFILNDGGQKEITESVSFSKSYSEKQKVLVEVTKEGSEEPYTVWFWVDVEAGE